MIKSITLGEDDGFLFGGVPTLVCVFVDFDDGRSVKFLCSADKSINQLYADLARFTESPRPFVPATEEQIKKSIQDLADLPNNPDLPESRLRKSLGIDDAFKSTVIERGDIVECVHLENRNDHAGTKATEDLVVGGKYRVTKILPGGYECIDDAAPMKFKLFLMKHEVKLFAKGKPADKKKLFLEEGIQCPKCNDLVYCGLHDGFYVGKCECGQDIRISREEVKNGQSGNCVPQAA